MGRRFGDPYPWPMPLYSGVPPWAFYNSSLDFNFPSGLYYGGNLANSLSLSRASTGMAQDTAGILYSFASGVPRITNQGFLIEEARTNVLVPSNGIGSWLLTTVSTSQNLTDPSLVANSGWTVTQTGANGTDSRAQRNVIVANDSTTYTVSVYVLKTASAPSAYPAVTMLLTGGTSVSAGVVVDPVNGLVTTAAGLTTSPGSPTVTSAGAWWRVSFTIANNSTGNTTFATLFYPAWASTFTGTKGTIQNGSNGFAFGQVEAGSFPTSYIPTVGASATRAADIPQLIGAAASAALNAKAAFFQTTQVGGGVSPNFLNFASDTTSMFWTSSTQPRIFNGAASAIATLGSGTFAGTAKVSFGFDTSSITAVGNGGTKVSNAVGWSAGTPVILGNKPTGDRALNGYMQRFALSPVKGAYDGFTA